MNELTALLLVAAAAFLFFGAIPGIGAFAVRARWRLFRQRLRESSLLPFLQYSDLVKSGESAPLLGSYRVFGDLEAIQGSHRIWVNNGQFSVCVDLQGVLVYLLPSAARRSGGPEAPGRSTESAAELLPDEQPTTVPWNQIFSLPAGTRMFVSGEVFSEQDGAVFRSRPGHPLLVVLYDGDRDTILQRAIWGGRQRNEYWNPFTVASLLTGSFCMLLLAFVLLRSPLARLAALTALSLAFFPLAGIIPPGFLLYYLYRHFWRTARRLRAERDMLRLPLRYYPDPKAPPGPGSPPACHEALTRLPTGEPYLMSEDPGLLIRGELAIRGAGWEMYPPARRREGAGGPGEARPMLFGTPAWIDGGTPAWVDGGTPVWTTDETPAWVDGEAPGRESGRASGAERWLERPSDPMAELVLVLGEPSRLAEACDRRARLFEFLSGLCVLGALLLNHFLLLLAWNWLIR